MKTEANLETVQLRIVKRHLRFMFGKIILVPETQHQKFGSRYTRTAFGSYKLNAPAVPGNKAKVEIMDFWTRDMFDVIATAVQKRHKRIRPIPFT
mmetsp:Transcript_2441/g.3845  ORF Transcript_2441/g.3845 Transcript_2441/m.3845 type:complete len:95 (-) Transcript_2441:866-1150(-)